MPRTPIMAQELAANLMVHMAENPELLGQFLAASGLHVEDLRMMSRDGTAGAAMLDFLAEDDARLIECARSLGVAPKELMTARTALAGPGSYGWSVD